MAATAQSDADDASSKAGPNEDVATPESNSNGDSSPSMADRLATAARVIWAAFLVGIVLFTLIPVAGVLAGVTPFPAPDPIPYYAFVGVALVGTVAIVGTAIYDV